MGKAMLTPPLEYIEPTGHNHQFKFTRPQSVEPSSRPSSVSDRAYAATTTVASEVEDESEEESEQEEEIPKRRVERAQFVLEELGSDPGYDCDVEVLRPDQYEDAKSDKSADKSGTKAEVLARMNELQLEEDTSEDEERERRYQRKKKRWSAGIFKRSHSQSVEGDSSYSDNDPLDDIDPTARRLRRKTLHRGPCLDRRGSLIFEDRGVSNTNNILEVEEPDEGIVLHSKGPPSIPSDDAFTLDELPFYQGGHDMDDAFTLDELPFYGGGHDMDVEFTLDELPFYGGGHDMDVEFDSE
jgi:hypothetical protein